MHTIQQESVAELFFSQYNNRIFAVQFFSFPYLLVQALKCGTHFNKYCSRPLYEWYIQHHTPDCTYSL